MNLYRKVDPSLWDDEKFLELGDDAQSIWLLLLTGPQTCQIPGLQLADVYTLASARRWKVERVQAAIDEITAKAMAEFDTRFRIVRLPNGPRFNPPANPSVLVGWWKEWQRLPASPLKWKHIQSIKDAVEFDEFTTVTGDAAKDMKGNFDTVWTRTFNTVLDRVSDRVSIEQKTPCGTPSAHQDQHSGFSIQDSGELHAGSASPPASAEQLGLENQEPPKPAKKPESAELVAYFAAAWVKACAPADGKPPTLTAADRGQASQLVKKHGLDACKGYVDQYLADGDTFLVKTGYALKNLAAKVDAYRSRASPSPMVGHAKAAPHNTESRIRDDF